MNYEIEDCARKARENKEAADIKQAERMMVRKRYASIMGLVLAGGGLIAYVSIMSGLATYLRKVFNITSPKPQQTIETQVRKIDGLTTNEQDTKFIEEYFASKLTEGDVINSSVIRTLNDLFSKTPEIREELIRTLETTGPKEFLLINAPYFALTDIPKEEVEQILANSNNPQLVTLQKVIEIIRGKRLQNYDLLRICALLQELHDTKELIISDFEKYLTATDQKNLKKLKKDLNPEGFEEARAELQEHKITEALTNKINEILKLTPEEFSAKARSLLAGNKHPLALGSLLLVLEGNTVSKPTQSSNSSMRNSELFRGSKKDVYRPLRA